MSTNVFTVCFTLDFNNLLDIFFAKKQRGRLQIASLLFYFFIIELIVQN